MNFLGINTGKYAIASVYYDGNNLFKIGPFQIDMKFVLHNKPCDVETQIDAVQLTLVLPQAL